MVVISSRISYLFQCVLVAHGPRTTTLGPCNERLILTLTGGGSERDLGAYGTVLCLEGGASDDSKLVCTDGQSTGE